MTLATPTNQAKHGNNPQNPPAEPRNDSGSCTNPRRTPKKSVSSRYPYVVLISVIVVFVGWGRGCWSWTVWGEGVA